MLRLWSWAAGFTSPWDSSDVKTRFEGRPWQPCRCAQSCRCSARGDGMYLTSVERSWRREGCRPRAEGGGVPRPPPDGSDQRASSGVSEDPEAAVAVAAEDVGEAVFADERLDAPEVVAFGVEVAAHLDELTRRVVLRVGALDLNRAQPARVVGQVGQ